MIAFYNSLDQLSSTSTELVDRRIFSLFKEWCEIVIFFKAKLSEILFWETERLYQKRERIVLIRSRALWKLFVQRSCQELRFCFCLWCGELLKAFFFIWEPWWRGRIEPRAIMLGKRLQCHHRCITSRWDYLVEETRASQCTLQAISILSALSAHGRIRATSVDKSPQLPCPSSSMH